MSSVQLSLLPLEKQARNHALLCSIGFLVLLPVGVLLARYARTFTNKWWYVHFVVQLVIAGPVIWAGWSLGYRTSEDLHYPHFKQSEHQKVGLALLILYLVQLVLGLFVHFFKFPSIFRGYRAPHNYLHVVIGLATLALAQFQVHYGLFTEWPTATGGLHMVPQSAKRAWLALLIVFWVLYGLGMALIPRQFDQEREFRAKNFKESSEGGILNGD
ncbi:hypothetical protein AMATHDRAFT_64230 [Amanita thiersii Skay4041]|uniref:Cytochrome b561 domain-containing protein n=1 Tax=Amanita thiersii Skay4041 TaxID=703135 RepID=A0A2A9NMI3_9AGAR|nr:hypothetical protein AMATHDRAFT_64230 [Amanita thiersii Skay4041]